MTSLVKNNCRQIQHFATRKKSLKIFINYIKVKDFALNHYIN